MDDHESGKFGENRPEIDRGPLRNILLDSLKPETVVWDSQFASMERGGEGWQLHFKNGTSVYADIVIATDGANSKIRPYITDVKPVYSGITIVEGNIYNAEKNAPSIHRLLKGGKIFAFGDEQSLIVSSKGDGSISFYTGCKVEESWVQNSKINFNNQDQVLGWFKNAFDSWDTVWQELVTSNEVSFIPRPQYHFPLNQHWEALPNLTMIGDAAHRMPPYAGEGVNMALQDALELADCLTNNHFTTIQSAIASFEKTMRLRTSEITQVTLHSTEMLHSKDAIANLQKMFSGE
jgi:2-polyprenyl-6-methoxyphenol hydroxylase-like FAD-dependent oxidoreductase